MDVVVSLWGANDFMMKEKYGMQLLGKIDNIFMYADECSHACVCVLFHHQCMFCEFYSNFLP